MFKINFYEQETIKAIKREVCLKYQAFTLLTEFNIIFSCLILIPPAIFCGIQCHCDHDFHKRGKLIHILILTVQCMRLVLRSFPVFLETKSFCLYHTSRAFHRNGTSHNIQLEVYESSFVCFPCTLPLERRSHSIRLFINQPTT